MLRVRPPPPSRAPTGANSEPGRGGGHAHTDPKPRCAPSLAAGLGVRVAPGGAVRVSTLSAAPFASATPRPFSALQTPPPLL